MRLLILPLLLSLACASSNPPISAKKPVLTSSLLAEMVLDACQTTHRNFQSRKSPVDCELGAPRYLHVTFPDYTLFQEKRGEVSAFARDWCAAVQLRDKTNGYFGWTLRKEGITGIVRCRSHPGT